MKRKGKPQPKPKQPDFEIDPEVLEEIKALESAPWYITAFQKGDPNLPWYKAMDAAETRGNKKPLIEMLLDPKREVTPTVRECLADLLKRYKLVSLPGKQQIPIYAVSPVDAWCFLLRAEVLKLTANGTSQKEAITRVASYYNVDEEMLATAVIGKRGSLNRALNKLARLTSKEWAYKHGWRKL